jgi:hypothetical protein
VNNDKEERTHPDEEKHNQEITELKIVYKDSFH